MPGPSTFTLSACTPAQAADGGAAPERRNAAARLQRALHALQQSRWDEAFSQLTPLADEGHPQAARLALLFAQRGTRLFGGRYEASAAQQRAWSRVAA